jgi:xanthine dehydrogenase molybdopterin-binding subunit B
MFFIFMMFRTFSIFNVFLQVSVHVGRIGGGFGGKGMKSSLIGVAAAIASFIMKTRVRIEIPLSQSIQFIGIRLWLKYSLYKIIKHYKK